MTRLITVFALILFPLLCADQTPLPIRGLQVRVLRPDEVDTAVRFIREDLPKEGVNVLVLEFEYTYQFKKRPEVIGPNPLSAEDVKRLVAAAREAGIKLIPQINLLGHQTWAKTTHALLRAHPEFDETPGKYPDNQGIYCRSYCPLHPGINAVLFDLIDELVKVCESDAFHAGMDEVFLLGEDDCPRCKGKNKAELFAYAVTTIRDHLAKSNRTLWIWGDRMLDGAITGLGKYEASMNGTAPSMRLLPKDVIISDWHYSRAVPTAAQFALEGYRVVSCPWRQPEVALGQLELIRNVRKNSNNVIASRMQGVLHTTWTSMGQFMKAYYGQEAQVNAKESANCFKQLFAEIRKGGLK